MSSQTKILSETRIHIHMLTLTTNNIDQYSSNEYPQSMFSSNNKKK